MYSDKWDSEHVKMDQTQEKLIFKHNVFNVHVF